MTTHDLARIVMTTGPEPLTVTGQQSHNPLVIHVTFPPEEAAPLIIRKQNSRFIHECCRSDWQNPLNDF